MQGTRSQARDGSRPRRLYRHDPWRSGTGSRNGSRNPEAANRTPWDTRELPPAPSTHRRRPRWNRLVWHQAAAPRRPSKLKEPSVPLPAEICSSCCPPWESKGQYSSGFAGKPPFLGTVLNEVPKGVQATGGDIRIGPQIPGRRSEEHTSELQSLMRISYAVFCLNKKKQTLLQKNIANYR